MFIKKRSLNIADKVFIFLSLFSALILLLCSFLFAASASALVILALVLFSASLALAIFVRHSFSRRLTEIIFKIEEMAAGNFSKKLRTDAHGELGQLCHSINELMSRLNTGVAQDVSKHSELSRAKSDFVALASHQLRTPLSIIKWYVDFIVSGDAGALNPEQMKFLKEVYISNERLIELVNALLDVSRIDVGTFSIEPEPTHITQWIEAALEKLDKEIKTKKLIVRKKFDEIPEINLDPRLTKIFFENIISNSVKYTPEGGMVQVVMRKTDTDVLIKISDNGCGIPREQQPKIFTKMFRADNVKKIESVGTGLGLYISKAIIEKSGGKIWFQSPSFDLLLDPANPEAKVPIDKQNQGTTFFITIPLKGMKRREGTKRLVGSK
jgi:signal transduction histidine kinase